MPSQYVDKQYSKSLSPSAIKDLKIFFFDSFFSGTRKILDVGCSVGRIMNIIGKDRATGIDIDKIALSVALKKDFNVKWGDISKKISFSDRTFDGVFCSQVVEHLVNPLYSMEEMKRVLRSGGKIILITPDYILNHNKVKDGFWSDYTHKTPFTKESLLRLAYDAGFKNYRVYHLPGRGFRNLIRAGILSKEQWIKLDKTPFVWRSQDLVLEAVK